MNYRFMRCILFFDLPSITKTDLREYRKFVKLIKNEGFVMLQESVYTKLCLNQGVVDATIARVKAELPKEGIVSVLTITEKQFSSITQLLGEIETDVELSDSKLIVL